MNQSSREPLDEPGTASDAETAEARLRASRARMRASLASPAATAREPTAGDLLEHVVKPAAGELVRRHPIASLAGAALAGAMLVRARPLSGLIGSVATAVLVRRLADAATHWIDTTTTARAGPARVSSTGPTAAEREAAGPPPDAEP